MRKRTENHLQSLHTRNQFQRSVKRKSLSTSEKREVSRKKKEASKHSKKDKEIALERLREQQEISIEKERILERLNKRVKERQDAQVAAQLREKELYYESLLKDSRESDQEASNATKECVLNFAGAALAAVVSLLSGGLVPSILMLAAGVTVMGGFFFKKWRVSDDVSSEKKGVIKAMLASSFVKRTDDILKGCMMIGGLTGALSAVALPFAIITLFSSALAFGLAAHSYRKNPEKADKLAFIGTGLNLLGSMAMVGIAISALFVGAAALSNPIGAAIVGILLVGAAIIKLKSAIDAKRKAKRELKFLKKEKESYSAGNSDHKFDLKPLPDGVSCDYSSRLQDLGENRGTKYMERQHFVSRARYNKSKSKPVERTRAPLRWSTSGSIEYADTSASTAEEIQKAGLGDSMQRQPSTNENCGSIESTDTTATEELQSAGLEDSTQHQPQPSASGSYTHRTTRSPKKH